MDEFGNNPSVEKPKNAKKTIAIVAVVVIALAIAIAVALISGRSGSSSGAKDNAQSQVAGQNAQSVRTGNEGADAAHDSELPEIGIGAEAGTTPDATAEGQSSSPVKKSDSPSDTSSSEEVGPERHESRGTAIELPEDELPEDL